MLTIFLLALLSNLPSILLADCSFTINSAAQEVKAGSSSTTSGSWPQIDDPAKCLASAEKCNSRRDCSNFAYKESCLLAPIPLFSDIGQVSCCFQCCVEHLITHYGLGNSSSLPPNFPLISDEAFAALSSVILGREGSLSGDPRASTFRLATVLPANVSVAELVRSTSRSVTVLHRPTAACARGETWLPVLQQQVLYGNPRLSRLLSSQLFCASSAASAAAAASAYSYKAGSKVALLPVGPERPELVLSQQKQQKAQGLTGLAEWIARKDTLSLACLDPAKPAHEAIRRSLKANGLAASEVAGDVSARYRSLVRARFAVSPSLIGGDVLSACEWEALALGAIPVLLKPSVQQTLVGALFEGLPVVFVGSWAEVTPALLEAHRTKVSSGLPASLSISRAFLPHWLHEVIKGMPHARHGVRRSLAPSLLRLRQFLASPLSVCSAVARSSPTEPLDLVLARRGGSSSSNNSSSRSSSSSSSSSSSRGSSSSRRSSAYSSRHHGDAGGGDRGDGWGFGGEHLRYELLDDTPLSSPLFSLAPLLPQPAQAQAQAQAQAHPQKPKQRLRSRQRERQGNDGDLSCRLGPSTIDVVVPRCCETRAELAWLPALLLLSPQLRAHVYYKCPRCVPASKIGSPEEAWHTRGKGAEGKGGALHVLEDDFLLSTEGGLRGRVQQLPAWDGPINTKEAGAYLAHIVSLFSPASASASTAANYTLFLHADPASHVSLQLFERALALLLLCTPGQPGTKLDFLPLAALYLGPSWGTPQGSEESWRACRSSLYRFLDINTLDAAARNTSSQGPGTGTGAMSSPVSPRSGRRAAAIQSFVSKPRPALTGHEEVAGYKAGMFIASNAALARRPRDFWVRALKALRGAQEQGLPCPEMREDFARGPMMGGQLERLWHILFGLAPVQPSRGYDRRLPTALREKDCPGVGHCLGAV